MLVVEVSYVLKEQFLTSSYELETHGTDLQQVHAMTCLNLKLVPMHCLSLLIHLSTNHSYGYGTFPKINCYCITGGRCGVSRFACPEGKCLSFNSTCSKSAVTEEHCLDKSNIPSVCGKHYLMCVVIICSKFKSRLIKSSLDRMGSY